MKIAATVEATMEILQDHEAFAQWLPVELQRWPRAGTGDF
jgi:hypothetical protein